MPAQIQVDSEDEVDADPVDDEDDEETDEALMTLDYSLEGQVRCFNNSRLYACLSKQVPARNLTLKKECTRPHTFLMITYLCFCFPF